MPSRSVYVTVALAAAIAGCRGPVAEGPTSSPLTARPSPGGTPPDLQRPTELATTATASPGLQSAASASDVERARFVARQRREAAEDARDVAVDLDGDGMKEVILAYAWDDVALVRVGSWTGSSYEVSAEVTGGPADDVVDLVVRDVNDDGRIDVVTFQRIGASGHSATIWTSGVGGSLEPLDAVGGCFDGRNTYGDTGAALSDEDGDGDADVRAACEDPDLPQPLWPTLVYLWEDGAYRCDHRELPEGDEQPCE